MNPDICLSRLGEILGTKITLDDQQQALLIIDNYLYISLRFTHNQWIIYGMVGQLSEEEKYHLPAQYWKELLKLNLEWAQKREGSLCFSETTSALLYVDSPTTITNGDELYQYLNSFTQQLEKNISLTKMSQHLM